MYLFLLGRDGALSKLELAIYLQKQKISYSIIVNSEKYLILDFNKEQKFYNLTRELGGIVRVSKVYLKTTKIKSNNEIIDKLDFNTPKKFNYTISSIDISEDELEIVEDVLKISFKKEKAKAVYKKPITHSSHKSKSNINHIANPDNYFSWGVDSGLELFLVKHENTFYFAKTISCFNPKDNIFKDKHRPIIKEMYNTSFRLVSIMINLLGLEKGKTFVDPFCGTGTFLIEGLIKGYNIVGIDHSAEMVDASNKNVSWAIKTFKLKGHSKIIRGDSAKTKFQADASVFEPYMGPFLRKALTYDKAKTIVKELNEIYFKVFENLSKNLLQKSRVVCILPELKTFDKKIVSINKGVYEKNGFELVDVNKINKDLELINQIPYTTPSGSMINRKIYILEKRR
jgi:tRNA G10  N-methylase Trm11